ncbi:MAG: hypothetical protein ACXV8M_12045 [Candidatus Angelobacter sp.]
MSFQRESEMARPVRQWLRREDFLIKEEFVLPWGICDFVAVSLNPSRVQKRLGFGQRLPVGPLNRIHILNQIPDRESGHAITFRRLLQTVGGTLSEAFIKQELERLIDARFVVKTRNGSLQKLNGWAPLHDRVIAIELKLSRVSEALAQAYSNRAVATESYVALPVELAFHLSETRRRAEFEEAGVGVIAVSKLKCRIVVPATDAGSHTDSAIQMHCVERFWRTKDNLA